MSEKSKRVRRTFTDEFKQDAVDLVVKQGYSDCSLLGERRMERLRSRKNMKSG